MQAGGLTTFAGAVGNARGLASLTTDGAGTTDLNGALVQATTVVFGDAVVLSADLTVSGVAVGLGVGVAVGAADG